MLHLFGTDGVRGLANRYPMTSEVALTLGRAVTHLVGLGKNHSPRILIGKDTRLSGYMIETALASGICSMGGRVLLCGPIPTPAVAHLTTSMRADAGMVISASHNPYQDNGIKIFGSDGFKLADSLEKTIESFVLHEHGFDHSKKTSPTSKWSLPAGPDGPGIGRAEKLEDARGRYVAFAKRTFPSSLSLEGLHVVIDAAHGAAYKVSPSVFSELGAKVSCIGIRPSGLNINHEVGALHPDRARREVIKKQADVGIALDGDADRLMLIDEKGQLVDGDVVMAICAKRMLLENKLVKKTVVATVMSNIGLEKALYKAGGQLLRTQVGDRHVVTAMRKGGYTLGGEQSGHLIFMEHAPTGDGIVAALQVLAIMIREEKSLSVLAYEAIEKFPQVLMNVQFASKMPVENMTHLQTRAKQFEKQLGKEGRILIRWSGTETKLRIMIEGQNESTIWDMAHALEAEAKKDLPVKKES